jgi:hypothetical protein
MIYEKLKFDLLEVVVITTFVALIDTSMGAPVADA